MVLLLLANRIGIAEVPKVMVANLGDSRAILCRAGQAAQRISSLEHSFSGSRASVLS